MDGAYEENGNRKTQSRDGMASAGQTTESVNNVYLPSHAWVSVAVIVNYVWPRIVWSYFHICSLALWNDRNKIMAVI